MSEEDVKELRDLFSRDNRQQLGYLEVSHVTED